MISILDGKYKVTHTHITRKGVDYDLTKITEAQAEELIKDGSKSIIKATEENKVAKAR
jgi:hypothetical protein